MRKTLLLLVAGALILAVDASADADLVTRNVAVSDSVLAAMDPFASFWDAAAPAEVVAIGQAVTTPSLLDVPPVALEVRGVHNGRWIALRIAWPDSTRDASVEVSRFSDQVAVQWPVSLDPGVSPFMGTPHDPRGRVHIVHWKAIWQDDIDHGYQDVQTLHPHFWSDLYYMAAQDLYPFPVAQSFNSPEARVALMGVYAGNPVSQPQRSTPVEDLMAEGFGTLTTQPRQNCFGRGVWKDGYWNVVITRPLTTDDPLDAPLSLGQEIPIAFAVWDGAGKHVGARKRFVPWITMILEPPK